MLGRFNQALEYIEDNLCGEIDFGRVFRIACCSEYHFRRVFSHFAGVSLGEYIRRRRLTVAVDLLRQGGRSVIELAFALGYETPEAFSRAFRAMHGISPTGAKNPNAQTSVFLPISFQLSTIGGLVMKVRIVEKEAFAIVGFKKRITLQFVGVNPQMDSLVGRLTAESIAQLKALSNTQPQGIISVSANFVDRTTEGTELDQYIGVATTAHADAPSGFDVLQLPKTTYAVFESVGKFPDALQATWGAVFSQWLPSSGFQLADGAELLWNESADTTNPSYKSEIWIPVQKV